MDQVIADDGLDTFRGDDELARELFSGMVRARRFDEQAVSLQRQGWMSGYPPFAGQEAAQIGAAYAMADDDVLVPTYRSNALQIARGVPMSDVLLFRRGYPEYASDHGIPILPQTVPIASQIPHATGVGMAANYRDEAYAALVCFGDGATSEGDFHEGLNFAGVFEAPVVFFCENNGWAISMPERRQTASTSIAAKATAYGIEGMQVDGNDPFAVYETVDDALALAKMGKPILIEALTYRRGAHTTADDPSVYRDPDPDLPAWRGRDPIDRVEEFLLAEGVIDDGFREEVRDRAETELAEAVATAERRTPDPDDLFDHVFETVSPALERQRAELDDYLAQSRGDPIECESSVGEPPGDESPEE